MLKTTRISGLQAIVGHWETLAPFWFRKIDLPTSEQWEITLSDGDFVDAEFWMGQNQGKWAIVTHGLEGSSKASYVQILTHHLLHSGYSVLAWNFRGCSGRMNRNLRLYHSGAFEDLGEVISACHHRFSIQSMQLFGFSLGGNLSLVAGARLGASFFADHRIKKITAISPPLDLAASARKLEMPWNKGYSWNFLKDLKSKIRKKAAQFPDQVSTNHFRHSHSIISFDNHYTAPLHGFQDAADYYRKCSSRFMLEDIPVATEIILALNDPMLARGFLAYQKIRNKNVRFTFFPRGGHCGFWGKEMVWLGMSNSQFPAGHQQSGDT